MFDTQETVQYLQTKPSSPQITPNQRKKVPPIKVTVVKVNKSPTSMKATSASSSFDFFSFSKSSKSAISHGLRLFYPFYTEHHRNHRTSTPKLLLTPRLSLHLMANSTAGIE